MYNDESFLLINLRIIYDMDVTKRTDVRLYYRKMNLKDFTEKVVPLREELLIQAQRLSRNDDSAEDLVQEVMLRLWNMHDSLENHQNVKALALTILRNKYTDQWRHRQLESGKESCYEASTNDNAAEMNDEMAIIRTIIKHLPPLQQKIMTMKEIEGYEAEEIIKITGCTADSLRQNLSRARRRIQQEYIRMTKVRIYETDGYINQ